MISLEIFDGFSSVLIMLLSFIWNGGRFHVSDVILIAKCRK